MQPLGVSQVELQLQINNAKDSVPDTSIAQCGFIRYGSIQDFARLFVIDYACQVLLASYLARKLLHAGVFCWTTKLWWSAVVH